MNTTKLRSKRVIVPTIAAVAVLGIGGTVWTASAADDLAGSERDRVGAAAVQAAGGGTATDVETSDDPGEAYEVEVRMDDGTERDVALDKDLEAVGQEVDDELDDDRDGDDRDGDGDDSDDDGVDDGVDDGLDDGDRALSAEERASAEEAALEAVGGGTVTSVQASDDRGEAYEVDVRDAGTQWDVELGEDFAVVRKTVDN